MAEAPITKKEDTDAENGRSHQIFESKVNPDFSSALSS